MAKILVVHPGPDFSVADVYNGWLKALRKSGHQISTYATNERLTFYGRALFEQPGEQPCEHGRMPTRRAVTDGAGIAQLAAKGLLEECFLNPPDVVFFISAFFQTGDALQALKDHGIKIVMLHTESPYEDGVQLERAVRCDISLVNDPTNLGTFRKASKIAEYMPHAYRPSLHHPGPASPELESDFAFVGTGYGSRCDFLEAMDFKDLDVLLAGNWVMLDDVNAASMLGPGGGRTGSPLLKYVAHGLDECLDNEQAVEIYRSTKVSINLYRKEIDADDKFATQTGWAMGPREVELAACGTFFLRDPRPEGDKVLNMLPKFSGPEEASEQLHWWLAHPELAALRARQAREAVAGRTFANHAAKVLKMIDSL